jgi:hypothetical protein
MVASRAAGSEQKKGLPMLISEEDMYALALADGAREVAIRDLIAGYDDREPFVTYLKRIKPEKPHCWSAPAAETVEEAALYNLDAQGEYLKKHGLEATRSLLTTEGLRIGQIKPSIKVDPAKIPGETNPWSPNFKCKNEAERQARIESIIRGLGAKAAAGMAAACGKTLTGRPLRK